MTVDAKLRLSTASEVKRAVYFDKLNWNDVIFCRLKPPFVPRLREAADTKYFDEEFTSMAAVLPGEKNLKEEGDFADFDFVNPIYRS